MVLIVPVWLIAKQREDLLVKWICLTIAVDIFDPKLVVNLPAARMAGLLLLPSSLAALPAIRRSQAGKAIWYYLIYLGCMGVVFGFIFPWSSEGFDRLPTQMSQARAVIYFVRKVADFSLAIFLARYLWRRRRPDLLIEWFVYGTSVAAVGGVLQWLTRVDLYSLFTGAELLGLEDRMRGFNYEPRGLGLIVGQGLLFAIVLYARHRSWRRLAVVGLHISALFLAVSTSGLFVVGAGAVALLFVDFRTRKVLVTPSVLVLFLCAALVFISLGSSFLESWYSNVELRLSSDKPGSAPESRIEEFALRQDIFDSSVIMLFASRPALLLTGVGPGLAGLASTDYLPSSALFGWVVAQGSGLNTLPHVGLLSEACDGGLVGLFLGLVFILASDRALSDLIKNGGSSADNWRMARTTFWAATAIYLIQASPLSASFSIFLGIGLAATWLAPSRQTVVRKASGHLGRSLLLKGRTTGEGATT
jgi:hypothetical protein